MNNPSAHKTDIMKTFLYIFTITYFPDEPDSTTAVLPSGLFFLGTALLVIIADKMKSI